MEKPVTADEIILNAAVSTPDELEALLSKSGKRHYVYVLRRPDGVPHSGGLGTPFYVGEGVGRRVFEHVESARRNPTVRSAKYDAIRQIEASGQAVLHVIYSVADTPLLHREQELIARIGLAKHGAGPLTNEQTYDDAKAVDGRVMRKYAKNGRADPLLIPASFKVRHKKLVPGTNRPATATSVHGRLLALLQQSPGLTGEELLRRAAALDWSSHKSAYTLSGNVDVAWLAGYIDSAVFKAKRGYMSIAA